MSDGGLVINEDRSVQFGTFNRGLLIEPPQPRDNFHGGISALSQESLQDNRDWRPFLPTVEYQYNRLFDTYGCVSWSHLNGKEALWKRRYGENLNFSDRYTTVVSGTVPGFGNSMRAVAKSICVTDGVVPEEDWSWDMNTNQTQFFSPVPETLKAKGRDWLKTVNAQWEWVDETSEAIWNILHCSPVQVAVYAYGPLQNGIYRRTAIRANHCMLIVHGEWGKYLTAWDHYDAVYKKLAWDTMYWGAMRFDISKKNVTPEPMPGFQFKENTFYQLVDGIGGFRLYAAGKLYLDTLGKMLASWEVRNNGDTRGKVGVLKFKNIEGIPTYNLKGEVIGDE